MRLKGGNYQTGGISSTMIKEMVKCYVEILSCFPVKPIEPAWKALFSR